MSLQPDTPPTSKAVHIGTGEVYAVPSRTDADVVYGVTVVPWKGKKAYFCNCPARTECHHIRQTQLAELQARKPHLELVPKPDLKPLDFSDNFPTFGEYEPASWELG